MEMLNEEEKSKLRSLSKYIRSNGMKDGYIEFEADYSLPSMANKTNFDNNWMVEIPDFIKPVLQKIIDSAKDRIQYVDNYTFNQFEIMIDSINNVLSVGQNWGYYEESDTMENQWTIEEDPEINSIFNDLSESDETELTLSYNGSGDSGYIEDNFDEGDAVPRSAEDFAYSQLENLHGGWEINEGSQGRFIFDTENKTISLYHTFNEEQTENEEFLQIYFGK